MIRPDQITDFIESRSDACIEMKYEDDTRTVLIQRNEDEIVGFIPKVKLNDSVFLIEEALKHPLCGVTYYEHDSEYKILIEERHQIWSVLKIALNHLGWNQEHKICVNLK